MKVSQFGPEMLEAFRTATTRPIVLPPMSKSESTAFVHRMNQLRVALREEDHHYSPFAERVSISRKKNEVTNPNVPATYTITLAAADYKFAQMLAEAGVKLPELPEEIAADTEEHEEEGITPLRSVDALKDWMEGGDFGDD